MKLAIHLLLTITFAMLALWPREMVSQRSTASQGASLPVQKIGREDLIGIAVYSAPELSGSVRVESDGCIRLPMVQKRIQAAGLFPDELEDAITKELIDEMVLVRPIVTISIVEYRSRPITVSGAVRNPSTFQVVGTTTLLDAISMAGGLTENAGSEILISHRTQTAGITEPAVTERIKARSLLDGDDPAVNVTLEGGENIRVPVAAEVYVLGNVKKPGSFHLTDGNESSVLKALALSGGLDSYPKHTAYIYRMEDGQSARSEIPIQVKSILDHKAPDVALEANDILYIPDATGRRLSARVLETSLGVGLGLAGLLVSLTR